MSEDFDDEQFEDVGSDDDAENLVVPCPSCGVQVYEDAEQCPSCGDYIVHDARAWSDKPTWWVLLGVAGIIAVILVLSGLAF